MDAAETKPGGKRGAPSSRRFIITAFALMAVGAVAATLLAVGQTRLLDSNVRHLVDNMLTSIRLVGQLDEEVDERRALVASHIATVDANEMTALEGRLGIVHGRIEQRLQTYEPWIDLPGERDVWEQTRATSPRSTSRSRGRSRSGETTATPRRDSSWTRPRRGSRRSTRTSRASSPSTSAAPPRASTGSRRSGAGSS